MTRRGPSFGALGTPLRQKTSQAITIYAFKSTAATISHAQKTQQENKSPSRVERD